MPDFKDKTPNAETLAAFKELEDGGGEIHHGPYTLDEILAGMTGENLHGEVGPDSAVGNEFPNGEPDGESPGVGQPPT